MGSLRHNEIGTQVRASNTRKHSESLPRNKLTVGIDHAIKVALDPYPVTQQRLLDIFKGRASFTSIRSWRYGWSRPPMWAVKMLQAKIEARRRELYRVLDMLEGRTGGPGERGSRHLAAWRERKAREKEKATETAALNQQLD